MNAVSFSRTRATASCYNLATTSKGTILQVNQMWGSTKRLLSLTGMRWCWTIKRFESLVSDPTLVGLEPYIHELLGWNGKRERSDEWSAETDYEAIWWVFTVVDGHCIKLILCVDVGERQCYNLRVATVNNSQRWFSKYVSDSDSMQTLSHESFFPTTMSSNTDGVAIAQAGAQFLSGVAGYFFMVGSRVAA